jgi:hypothetical protein
MLCGLFRKPLQAKKQQGSKKNKLFQALFIKKADCMMSHLAKCQAIFTNEIEWMIGVTFSPNSRLVIDNTRFKTAHDHLKYLPTKEDLGNYHLELNIQYII